ncbi:MAG: hypothetical protein HY313_02015 [Acidobacteria bacterium]|nr:hypothetical protein [Acidobacteriota bacterium]
MQTGQFLKELHDKALDHITSLHFDKTHAMHFTLVSLYGSLIELTGCMLTLLENRGKIGIPSLFRTFLETYVEFHNLIQEPTYGYHMEASKVKEWIKIFRAAAEGNPYLAGIASMPNLSEVVEKEERQLKDLESKGYKPLTIYQRFERAGMVEVYRSLYNFVSSDCHSNIRALIERHVDLGDDDFTPVLYKNAPDERFLWLLGPTAELLVSATIDIHEYFKSGVVNEVRLFKDKLADACSSQSSGCEPSSHV